MSKTKKPKKQDELPEMKGAGVERPSIPEIDKAAEAYREVRDQRMALTKQEVEAKGVLRQIMESYKLEDYEYPGQDDDGNEVPCVVTVKPAGPPDVKVKVKAQYAEGEWAESEKEDVAV